MSDVPKDETGLKDPEKTVAALGITVKIINGPYPRQKKEWYSIGYLAQVSTPGITIGQFEYSLGIGHVKMEKIRENYGLFLNLSQDERQMFETWQAHPNADFIEKGLQLEVACKIAKRQKLQPNSIDVLYALVSDSEALDYANFEDWATSHGHDSDSLHAHTIYKACLDTALSMRAALGGKAMAELQEAFQDY